MPLHDDNMPGGIGDPDNEGYYDGEEYRPLPVNHASVLRNYNGKYHQKEVSRKRLRKERDVQILSRAESQSEEGRTVTWTVNSVKTEKTFNVTYSETSGTLVCTCAFFEEHRQCLHTGVMSSRMEITEDEGIIVDGSALQANAERPVLWKLADFWGKNSLLKLFRKATEDREAENSDFDERAARIRIIARHDFEFSEEGVKEIAFLVTAADVDRVFVITYAPDVRLLTCNCVNNRLHGTCLHVKAVATRLTIDGENVVDLSSAALQPQTELREEGEN